MTVDVLFQTVYEEAGAPKVSFVTVKAAGMRGRPSICPCGGIPFQDVEFAVRVVGGRISETILQVFAVAHP